MNPTAQDIKAMFNKISSEYDFLNNIISFFTHILVKKAALKTLNIKDGAKVLDLCSGSGDLGRIVKDTMPGAEVFGVDFSENMIQIAKKKNPDIKYLNADALQLPFEDNYFDYIVMGFGLRNIPDKNRALSEIYRTLKYDGKFLHLDFGKKTIFNKIYDVVVTFFASFFKDKEAYLYLIKSKNNFFSPEELIKIFKDAGFDCILKKELLFKIISFQIFIK